MFCDQPAALKRTLHNSVIAISTPDPRKVRTAIEKLPGIRNVVLVGDGVHLVVDDAARMIPELRATNGCGVRRAMRRWKP